MTWKQAPIWRAARTLFAVRAALCVICERDIRLSARGKLAMICESCRSRITWIRDIRCPVCGRPEECSDCRRRANTYFTANRAAVSYSPAMKEWLALFKYRGHERMNGLFVEMLLETYRGWASELKGNRPPFDWITYVPVSRKRLLERGFNQAEQFARGVSQASGIPVVSLLERVRHTEKQSFKARRERLSDLESVFAIRSTEVRRLLSPGGQTSAKPGRILLLDDVYTTGSTLNQCAMTIRRYMNAEIYGMTWAR